MESRQVGSEERQSAKENKSSDILAGLNSECLFSLSSRDCKSEVK